MRKGKVVAAIATDTWGVEVRPNEMDEVISPFYWIAIPMIRLSLGEIFYVAELGTHCAEDRQYEFMAIWRTQRRTTARTMLIAAADGSSA